MLKIEKTVLPSADQWEIIIEGMRNPYNSWDRMDSFCTHITDVETNDTTNAHFFMGEKDHERAMDLAKGGPVHGKYLRMIPVWMTINAPLYWWKEFDTYKVGTVANSCSTMHKIADKEFTREDFSCENLLSFTENDSDVPTTFSIADAETGYAYSPMDIMDMTIDMLNDCRERYLTTKNKPMKNEEARKQLMKKYWWQMIQLLPSSYMQKRTVFMTYAVLANIYEYRQNHPLNDCWPVLLKAIEDLPYSELITGKEVTE